LLRYLTLKLNLSFNIAEKLLKSHQDKRLSKLLYTHLISINFKIAVVNMFLEIEIWSNIVFCFDLITFLVLKHGGDNGFSKVKFVVIWDLWQTAYCC